MGLMRYLVVGMIGVLWVSISDPARGESKPIEPDPIVQTRIEWSDPQVRAGDRSVAGIVLDIRNSFHINPSQSHLHDPYLIPTELKVTHHPGDVSVGRIQYPPPTKVTVGPEDHPRMIDGYEHRVILYVPVEIPKTASIGSKEIKLELIYQSCDRTQCLPPVTITLTTRFNVVDEATPRTVSSDTGIFEGYEETSTGSTSSDVRFDLFGWGFAVNPFAAPGLILLLLIAGIGGMLLNFTPCVLPVIPLKILSLSQIAEDSSRRITLGVVMSLGVVSFWVGLAGLIAGVSGFTATNQLFQYPVFTITVGVVIAGMALGMCGLFNVRLPGFVYNFNPKQDTISGSFGFGIMTAVLSTPCTAPFMGSAAAWAATQHPATTLATFSAIGVGMGLPYLVLSIFPGLVGWLPRSGPGGELIKQVMGILLLAAACYFIGVGVTSWMTTPPDPPSVNYWWPVMGFLGLAGAWLGYRVMRIAPAWIPRIVFLVVGGAMITGSVYGVVRLTDRGPTDWVYYTPERFQEAIRDRKIVVMDFTAEWCLNCKWLERTVLDQPPVVELLTRKDVVPMKVDLTGNNEIGNRKLKEVGRVTIPLLVVFSPDGSPSFVSDFYTINQIIEAVNTAGE